MKFKEYLKGFSKQFALGFVFFLIFIIVFSLYHLPVLAVIYPCILCFAIGLVVLVIEYLKWKERCERLELLINSPLEQTFSFDETEDRIEVLYQELARTLQLQLADDAYHFNDRYTQMMDYYTMWVHQIKTPIAAMRLTLESMDSAEARKLTAELMRVEQYVNMVLTYLRLDSDSSDYVLKSYSVDEMVKPVIRKFSSEFIGRKLQFSYEPNETMLVTDDKWFSFVVEQVLSNALKYTKEGGINIRMDEKYLIIEDTGIGIAKEDLPRIFEKGFTGCNGRIDKRASGIGLFLSKKICDKLRLPILVESQAGAGTTVKIGIVQEEVCTKD